MLQLYLGKQTAELDNVLESPMNKQSGYRLVIEQFLLAFACFKFLFLDIISINTAVGCKTAKNIWFGQSRRPKMMLLLNTSVIGQLIAPLGL